MTSEELRAAAKGNARVWWAGAYGRVKRVARDGTWADMEWASNAQMVNSWHKRQQLRMLAAWRLIDEQGPSDDQ